MKRRKFLAALLAVPAAVALTPEPVDAVMLETPYIVPEELCFAPLAANDYMMYMTPAAEWLAYSANQQLDRFVRETVYEHRTESQ